MRALLSFSSLLSLNENAITTHSTKEGVPWSDVWNRDMSLCAGFDQHIHLNKHSKSSLPCYPASVVYGHAAGRGLDVKRWSVGLDSGCLYNHRLSSLVFNHKSSQDSQSDFEFEFEEDTMIDIEARKKHKQTIPFGDGKARIVSVSCKK